MMPKAAPDIRGGFSLSRQADETQATMPFISNCVSFGMRQYNLLTILILTFSLSGFHFSAQAQTDTDQEKRMKFQRESYVAFLEYKGYGPEVDSDGDVKFTFNERSYYLTIDKKDDKFFRIMRIANLKLDDEASISQVYKICHDLTQDLKVTKLYWYNSMVWASTELLVSDPTAFGGIFDKAMELTEDSYDRFVQEWNARSN